MVRATLLVGAGLVTLFVASMAAAHPHEYIQPNAGVGVAVISADCTGEAISFGAVCFAAGEATDSISIADDLVAPVSARACQDSNGDAILAPNECVRFCGSLFGATFNPALAVWVVLDSVGTGNLGIGPCGTLYSGATHGFVSHG